MKIAGSNKIVFVSTKPGAQECSFPTPSLEIQKDFNINIDMVTYAYPFLALLAATSSDVKEQN